MRHRPVALRGVAEEPTLDLVVEPAAGHGRERRARDLVDARRPEERAPALGHVLGVAGAAQQAVDEHEAEHVRLRELGLRADPAVQRVEGADHLQGQFRGDVPRHVGVALQRFQGPLAGEREAGEVRTHCAVPVCGALALERRDLRPVGVEERLDPGEALQHLLRRQVRAAGEHVSTRGEEGGGRPAAHVVAAVHVRVAVVVHADGDEVLVDRGDDAWVGVARLVHDVTPVAPHRGEREEDRAPQPKSLREGGLAPGAPLDLRGPVRAR